jgi:hypothetical protein
MRMSESKKICPILSSKSDSDFVPCLEYRCKWYIYGECALYWIADFSYYKLERADVEEDEDML